MKEKSKIYRSRSEIAVNVRVGPGAHARHVVFAPLSSGGSVYVTDDEQLQKALEGHPRFGQLFDDITPKAGAASQPQAKGKSGR